MLSRQNEKFERQRERKHAEQKRRTWQDEHSAGGEGVTEESASVALDRMRGSVLLKLNL